jgi:diaminopimelate epimerase
MIDITFQKWQGAGNDFIIIDNRNGQVSKLSKQDISWLCDRHFGIGADGLMLISLGKANDFSMDFYNSDGLPAEMCGNGGRCIVAMAYDLGLFDKKAVFTAPDGEHEASLLPNGWIRLKMKDVSAIEIVELEEFKGQPFVYLNTGVPHLVTFVNDIDGLDVAQLGRTIRYHKHFSPAGTNVNFVRIGSDGLDVRTYERGVEAETLACGTGNVASAIAAEFINNKALTSYNCRAIGGSLRVSFKKVSDSRFSDVWLEGPAEKVFTGIVRRQS